MNIFNHSLDCLIFDLDGTLYDASNGYVDHIRSNIFQFMYDQELVSRTESAEDIWRPLFKEHNQTYKGLRSGGFVFDRDEYWRFHRRGVADYLSSNSELAQMLSDMPLKKYIFTNCREREAMEALEALGVADQFEKVYGADFLGDCCKPQLEAFDLVLADIGVQPENTMFFEDSLKNLKAGASLGMATVLVKGMTADEEGYSDGENFNCVVSTLSDGGRELRDKVPILFARN